MSNNSTRGNENNKDSELASPEQLAEISLNSILFLYQILMALSITNGTYILLTGGNNYRLRPLASFNPIEIAAFLIFIFTIIVFYHGSVTIIHESYLNGFVGKKFRPFWDFMLLFIETGVFYALSLSLSTVSINIWPFFYLFGLLLIVDILWAFVTFSLNTKQRTVLIYVVINSITIIVGTALKLINVPYIDIILFSVLGVRTIIDYSFTYNKLFPKAFRKKLT